MENGRFILIRIYDIRKKTKRRYLLSLSLPLCVFLFFFALFYCALWIFNIVPTSKIDSSFRKHFHIRKTAAPIPSRNLLINSPFCFFFAELNFLKRSSPPLPPAFYAISFLLQKREINLEGHKSLRILHIFSKFGSYRKVLIAIFR